MLTMLPVHLLAHTADPRSPPTCSCSGVSASWRSSRVGRNLVLSCWLRWARSCATKGLLLVLLALLLAVRPMLPGGAEAGVLGALGLVRALEARPLLGLPPLLPPARAAAHCACRRG